MDGHLEWAMKRSDNRNEIKKDNIDDKIKRFLIKDKEIETEAQINAQKMKDNILNLINKRVAGRAEGIDKVEGFLAKQERFNE